MLKCKKCNNHYQDNFKWNDINEYICRDCNAIVSDDAYIELYNDTTTVADMECGCTILEIEE